jgi:hypothetical protein
MSAYGHTPRGQEGRTLDDEHDSDKLGESVEVHSRDMK